MRDREASALLGLPADCDAATVRRRYAELLREIRPEDDPERFQGLREAYETCLDHARRRAMTPAGQAPRAPDDDGFDDLDDDSFDERGATLDPHPGAPPSTLQDETAPSIADLARMDEVALRILAQPDAPALERLVGELPEAESLERRPILELAVIRQLAGGVEPSFEVEQTLARWFEWDDVQSGTRKVRWSYAEFMRFEAAMRLRHARVLRELLVRDLPGHRFEEREFLRRLARPRPRWRVWIDVALPMLARDSALDLLHAWDARLGPGALPALLDGEHLRVWRAATQANGNPHAFAVGMVRVLAFALCATAVIGLFAVKRMGFEVQTAQTLAGLFGILFAVGFVVLLVIHFVAVAMANPRGRSIGEWFKRVSDGRIRRVWKHALLLLVPLGLYLADAFGPAAASLLALAAIAAVQRGIAGVHVALLCVGSFVPLMDHVVSREVEPKLVAAGVASALVVLLADGIASHAMPRWSPQVLRRRPWLAFVAVALVLLAPLFAWLALGA